MEGLKVYYLDVQYRWSFKRGSGHINHYADGYAISNHNTIEELNLDNVNYAMATKRYGLVGRKFFDFRVTKIYDSKVVGRGNK